MRSISLATLAVALLQYSSALASNHLARRDYDNREYYAVELGKHTDPVEAAQRLQLDYEGPLGEIAGHYIFAGPKSDEDVVDNYRRRRKRRDAGESDIHIISSAKQETKKRHHKRVPAPPRIQSHANRGLLSTSDFPDGTKIMSEIAKTMEIHDPLFPKQWHLVGDPISAIAGNLLIRCPVQPAF